MKRERNISRDSKMILIKRKPKLEVILEHKNGIFERRLSLYQIKVNYKESQTNS